MKRIFAAVLSLGLVCSAQADPNYLRDNGEFQSVVTGTNSGDVIVNSGGNLAGTTALPNGTTATTQTFGDGTTKVATTSFVQNAYTYVISLFRFWLTGNVTYYVSNTAGAACGGFTCSMGSDSNNGLGPTTPFLTPQHAWDVISLTLDLHAYGVVAQIADGTFTSPSYVLSINDGPPGLSTPTNLVFQGNASNNTKVVFNGALAAVQCGQGLQGTAQYELKNIRIKSSAGHGLSISGCSVLFDNLDFNTVALAHIEANHHAFVTTLTPYTVSGNAQIHADAQTAAVIALHAGTITYSNSPVFVVNINAQYGGQVFIGGNTFVNAGTVTGVAFLVTQNGYIDIAQNAAGTSYIPGVGFAMSSGGQYDTFPSAAIGNIVGLGTGVGTALGINTGSAGSFVVNSGGLSTTKTVRAAGGSSDCTLIFTTGLLTGGSC